MESFHAHKFAYDIGFNRLEKKLCWCSSPRGISHLQKCPQTLEAHVEFLAATLTILLPEESVKAVERTS